MSKQIHQNLPSIVDGDDASYDLIFADGNGDPIDISDWTVFVTVKDHIRDSDTDAVISKDITTHADPVNGQTSFTFSNTETAELHGVKRYDVQIKKTDGSIRTILKGDVYFEPGVTERTSND